MPQVPEPSLSSVYLCGRVRVKCKRDNNASVRTYLSCHSQVVDTVVTQKNNRRMTSVGTLHRNSLFLFTVGCPVHIVPSDAGDQFFLSVSVHEISVRERLCSVHTLTALNNRVLSVRSVSEAAVRRVCKSCNVM